MIKRCIHIWQTSLVRAYTTYLQEAKLVLTRHQQQQMKERAGNIVLSDSSIWYYGG